ncbi:MAG: hypothetical protein P4N41_21475 [Negativicutes bacterium]|nr:hypothetical protein [Negativicutes bacterium]
MEKRPSWWGVLHPDLTGGLIAIIVFLLLSAIGNCFKLYSAIIDQDLYNASLTGLSAFLYVAPAFGLLRLKRWARFFEIGFSLLMIMLGIIVAFFLPVAGGFIIITHGLVAYYLWSKKCRRIFYPETE